MQSFAIIFIEPQLKKFGATPTSNENNIILHGSKITSFGHFGFDELLLKTIRKLEYTQPTPIQAQAVHVLVVCPGDMGRVLAPAALDQTGCLVAVFGVVVHGVR